MPDPRVANEVERRRWNDDRWIRAWPAREAVTSTVTPVLMAALDVQPGESVVDIGCGGGVATLECARLVSADGDVCGVDLSEALLRLARGRADDAGIANVAFALADAQTDDVPGGPFDLAISQFGVMFFDDPPVAFANIRRQLRPGGRLRFAAWQAAARNPWHTGATLGRFAVAPPAAPAASAPGPFSLSDTDASVALLAGAGFVDVVCTDVEQRVRVGAGALYDRGIFDFLDIPAEQHDAAERAVEDHLAPLLVAPGEYEVPIAFSIYAATNPIGD